MGDNQHFVPQFYFRFFSVDKRSICVLTRETGRTVAQASIRRQASKNRYYGDEVDRALKQLEGPSHAAIQSLIELGDPASLDTDSIGWVLTWLMLQRSRTEAARQASQPMNDKMLRLWLEMKIGNDDKLSDEDRASLLGTLDFVESDPKQNQAIQISSALQTALGLADLAPLLLVNKTNRPFVFSDAPVVFYNAFYRDVTLRGVLGVQTPGLMVILPLNPTTTLLLLDTQRYRMKRVVANTIAVRDLRDIAALNKLQIHAASQCVYFHDYEYAAYVSDLWKQEQNSLRRNLGLLFEAPGFDAETGEAMGDIVHTFQPHLPFKLALTFLKHEVVGDKDYRFSRRMNPV